MAITFREFQAGDERAILELFRIVFGRELTLEAWRWRFQESPGGHGVIDLAFDGEKLVGHYAVTAIRLAQRGKTVLTGLSGTTMTHPDARGGGLFTQQALRTYERMKAQGMACVWGFPNSNSHRGFVRSLGWKDIYEVPFFGLDVGAAADAVPKHAVEALASANNEIDALWERCATQHGWSVVRDAAYLKWRFFTNPDARYDGLAVREGADLRGYAMTKAYGESLQIVDLLADTTEHALSLVQHVVGLAKKTGKKRVELWLNVTTPLHHELEKMQFRPSGPITYFGAAPLASPCEGIHAPFDWRIAMSDSDVF